MLYEIVRCHRYVLFGHILLIGLSCSIASNYLNTKHFFFIMNDSNKRKALEHVSELFSEAESVFKNNPELSKRYIVIARKIAMKHKISFDRQKKMSFCKHCNAYLKRGINSIVRVREGRIILTCKECGFVRRFVYK